LDPISLQIFLQVAEEKSVTRAAARLGRAASSVTTRLQQLEKDLGSVLFSREGKRMTLTRQGKTFLSYARKLASLTAEARAALLGDDASEILRLGTMESTAASRLPPVLAQFSQTRPQVSIRLSLGATQDLVNAVISGDLDCALVARPSDQPDWVASLGHTRPLRATQIYREDLLLVLPPSHPPIEGPDDIAHVALAALEPGCTYRRAAERWLRSSANVQTLEVGSYHSILAHVVAGAAIGVMPRSVLEILNWSADLAIHPLGVVDTLLISRAGETSPPIDWLEAILLAAPSTGPAPVPRH
jgi:DNA-binding transcriptional LysR family regulator